MLRIAICDGHEDTLQTFKESLPEKLMDVVEFRLFETGKQLLQTFETGDCYDFVVLDGHAGADGVQTGMELRWKLHLREVLLVFVVQGEQELFACMDALPFGFLRNPFDQNKIQKLLNQAFQTLKKQFFTLDDARNNRPCLVEDILWFEIGENHRMQARLTSGTIEFRANMDTLEKQKDELGLSHFVRIRKSFLINMDQVRSYNNASVWMEGVETGILVSADYKESMKEAMMQYYGGDGTRAGK